MVYIITNQILNGIATPKNQIIAFEAAQILKNMVKNVKKMILLVILLILIKKL